MADKETTRLVDKIGTPALLELMAEEAIELAEKKAEIDAFEKSGVFNYLGDNAKAMWQKILDMGNFLKMSVFRLTKVRQFQLLDQMAVESQHFLK